MFYQIPQLTLNQVNPRHLTKVHLLWEYAFPLSLSFIKWRVHQNHSFASKTKHSRQQKEAKRKVSLLLIFKHMKVIQNALLYNKIECYNTGVHKEVAFSQRLHSLFEAGFITPNTRCLEGPQRWVEHCNCVRMLITPRRMM